MRYDDERFSPQLVQRAVLQTVGAGLAYLAVPLEMSQPCVLEDKWPMLPADVCGDLYEVTVLAVDLVCLLPHEHEGDHGYERARRVYAL